MIKELWYNRIGTDVTWSVPEGSDIQLRLASDSAYALQAPPVEPAPSTPAPVAQTASQPPVQVKGQTVVLQK